MKLIFNVEKGLKFTNISINKNQINVAISDNPNVNIVSILEKLLTTAKNYKLDKIALGTKDNIFKYVTLQEFKSVYTKLRSKLKINLKILIYKSPIRIDNKISMVNNKRISRISSWWSCRYKKDYKQN